MELLKRLWMTVNYVVNLMTLSPVEDTSLQQHPFLTSVDTTVHNLQDDDPRVFVPPGVDPGSTNFTCNYTRMAGWKPCSTADSRGCWLRHDDGTEFNITTDYETMAPVGIDRYYWLNTTETWYNADGLNFTAAKLFNNTYPGPWIQACWGDTVHINVTNKMVHNGTSIHWHGLRQLNSNQMDGVNGLTQCPIAPDDSFVQSFNITQYGTSWYHSHYSVQYADGLQGPLTLYGPTSASYNESKDPMLMTDWSHNSAFEIIAGGNNQLLAPSLLLNGRGNVTRFFGIPPQLEVPAPYELQFDAQDISKPGGPKRYLLRLINTSFGATFVFSIDNHVLQIVSTDFVPICPYTNTSVLVGIGQRYNVIVEAQPTTKQPNRTEPGPPIPKDGNFWIRNWVADNCGTTGGVPNYERVGILRYNASSKSDPTSSAWSPVSKACSDETYTSLKPVRPWEVGNASNDQVATYGELFRVTNKLIPPPPFQPPSTSPYPLFPIAAFSLEAASSTGWTPLQVQYSDPMFVHLNNTMNNTWPGSWVVTPEEYTDKDWVYLLLTGDKTGATVSAHPIHLHGHDFVILQQVENEQFVPERLDLHLDNPPRRDVVLLPRNGFVVIAFKTDNPGSWLMHCHIARHASEGLALQILERRKDANELWPVGSSKAQAEAERVCGNWKDWYGDCNNYWPGINASTGINPACDNQFFSFQDDSGI